MTLFMRKQRQKIQNRRSKFRFVRYPAGTFPASIGGFARRCGHELINEKCKLRCPRCHYFMSCSDFDFA